MFTKIYAALLTFLLSLSQLFFPPVVLRIDFDKVVDEIRPVHNIDRMPEYVTDSEVNRYFTQANMISCRTHDINCTDIFRIFPDFSADVNDESSYHFEESDKVAAAIIDTGMKPFFRLGISYSNAQKDHKLLLPPTDYDKWVQICAHIILHYNEGWADGFRYGIEYWEIWNEPDGGKYAATGEDGQALLISNISEKRDRTLKIDAGEYSVDKVMTVNENCEWVEIELPETIESGSMLYITFTKN